MSGVEVLGVVVAVVSILGGIVAFVDRLAGGRYRAERDVWRGLAEARQEESHDCREEIAELRERLDLLQSAWVQELGRQIAASIRKDLTDARHPRI